MPENNFVNQLNSKRRRVNQLLFDLLDQQKQIDPDIKKVLSYTLESGGKRIRGALVIWACQAISGRITRPAEIAAAAVEMVHTYSLIHDDLPAMDDDDLRRGRATCHIAFDEAIAILAGDALVTLAFQLIAELVDDHELAIKMISELARASGPEGMIAGQVADLKAEKQGGDIEILEYIHTNKTAKMFVCSAAMGALAGNADSNQLKCIRDYGLKIGLGFQVADDILDLCGSSEELGKTAGKDEKAGKLTYPALIGLDESRKLEKRLAAEAADALACFDDKADPLRNLAKAMVARTK